MAFDHVSIGVGQRDELWDIKDRLDAAGFWVSEVMDLGFIESLYSFDPNGIAVEFSWPRPGVDLRRNPALVGGRPAPAWPWKARSPNPGIGGTGGPPNPPSPKTG